MPVPLVSENKATKAKIIESIFLNDDKPVNYQRNDVLSNQNPTATNNEVKTNENNSRTKALNEKKFYFPAFNVKHHTQDPPHKAKQSQSRFAEKIQNHSVDDPHRGHKHYHKHEYHHLPSFHGDNHVPLCTHSSCAERDGKPELDQEFKSSVKVHDSVIIHEAPLQTTKLRVQNICCPKEARIVQEELGKLPGINTIRVNVLGRVAYISHDRDQVTPPEMLETLNKRHLGASVVDAGAEEDVDRGFPRNLKILLAFLCVQAVLFGIALAAMFLHASWYMWVAIVQICFGMLPVLKKCYHAIYHLQIDLNILITVTVIGTLGIQQWIEGAAVIFIFILANFLQEYCFYRVHKTISSLMLTKPSKAVLACTGELVPIEDVSVGRCGAECAH
jgi:copper chaperone CopZ